MNRVVAAFPLLITAVAFTAGVAPGAVLLFRQADAPSADTHRLIRRIPAASTDNTKTGLHAPAPQGDFTPVSFDTLGGFDYPPKGGDPPPIPKEVRALASKAVVITGYMIPTKVDSHGQVRTFLLAPSPFLFSLGTDPAPNRWVAVSMAKDAAVPLVSGTAVDVYGILDIDSAKAEDADGALYYLTGQAVRVRR